MIALSLADLVLATQGQLILDEALNDLFIDDIVTDSRVFKNSEQNNSAFLALKGTNFDGHRFAEQVVDDGCRLVIVDHEIAAIDSSFTVQLVVEDTRIALGQIAAYVKAKLAPKTVGITGSSGKTTVKEMTAAILSRLGKVLATEGNFNNDIGVPLTLLRLTAEHDFAVVEMGANHAGEIAYTCNLVKPDVAIINNIAAAHLEGFGDLCGVARAKGEIFSGLNDTGIALYNQDTKYTDKWQWRIVDKRVGTFSCSTNVNQSKADCYSTNVSLDENGCASFTLHTPLGDCFIVLNIPGQHNVCNAVAAASIALAFKASLDDIRVGLAQMQAVKGRLNLYQLNDNFKLIDDSYNANVESTKAATQLLSTYSGTKVLILGDIGELGSKARSYHQEIGQYSASLPIDVLLSLGVLSQSASDTFRLSEPNLAINTEKKAHSQHFNERGLLMQHLLKIIQPILANESAKQEVTILVKGSRSARMERVVGDIKHYYENSMSTEQANKLIKANEVNQVQVTITQKEDK